MHTACQTTIKPKYHITRLFTVYCITFNNDRRNCTKYNCVEFCLIIYNNVITLLLNQPIAKDPVSSVRMRMHSSRGIINIFPSPILPL